MVPFDFAYYRPQSIAEATALFAALERDGKRPLYYGGGTEIITLSRLNLVRTAAVIDIKSIPECRSLDVDNVLSCSERRSPSASSKKQIRSRY